MELIYIIAGLLLLFAGGEGLVRGSISIAKRLKLSNLLISTVIIGFGTSMPELAVSMDAAINNYPDIALGNIIGSNISNSLLVLGLAAAISLIPCATRPVKRDAIAGLAATFILAMISLTGYIQRWMGLYMIVVLAIYVMYIVWNEKYQSLISSLHQSGIESDLIEKDVSFSSAMLITPVSLISLLAGAHLLVLGAVAIASKLGISNAVIGLTIVAVGSSLPEISTAMIASWHKHADVVIGNILGSNLFNILSILGITALVKPIPFEGVIASRDIWIMLATSILLTAVVLIRNKIARTEAVVFLALYTAYVSWLYIS